MKNSLKVEELAMLLLSIYLFKQLDFSWWWYLVLFFTPDFGFLGYLISPKFGAFCYNLLHHKGVAILVYLIGVYSNNQILLLVGLVLFGHSSFDRILGYGLKYKDSFNNTHLGVIGNK